MIQENFIKIYENSFKENWSLPALTDYSKNVTFTFEDVAKEIARIHILFEECQIRRGDKIALIGKDSARWCIVYMAAVTYGAIIVPILQDFNPNDVHHIINHSESVFLFVIEQIGTRESFKRFVVKLFLHSPHKIITIGNNGREKKDFRFHGIDGGSPHNDRIHIAISQIVVQRIGRGVHKYPIILIGEHQVKLRYNRQFIFHNDRCLIRFIRDSDFTGDTSVLLGNK